MAPSLDVIIVNWNAGAHLQECLSSVAIAQNDAMSLQRVVVVDNASTDSSIEMLGKPRLPVEVVRNSQNRGFAAACNQGAQGSGADYLLFLNPDTRLGAEALSQSVQFMEERENRRVGILGIQLLDSSGAIARTCARFPTAGRLLAYMVGLDKALPAIFLPHFMVEWDHRQSQEVDQVMGAFFLVRRSVFERLGGFDERFFVYFEEVDLSLRARALGWHTYYLSEVQAFHHGSGKVRKRMPATRLFYSLRSRILYAYKHFNTVEATLVALGTLLVEPISRAVLAIVRGSPAQVMDTLKAYVMLWRTVPYGLHGDPDSR